MAGADASASNPEDATGIGDGNPRVRPTDVLIRFGRRMRRMFPADRRLWRRPDSSQVGVGPGGFNELVAIEHIRIARSPVAVYLVDRRAGVAVAVYRPDEGTEIGLVAAGVAAESTRRGVAMFDRARHDPGSCRFEIYLGGG